MSLEDLDRLKQALHPAAQMNVVEQCRIVYEAMLPDGIYPNGIFKVATHLSVSRNKVYKMKMIHIHCTSEMKEWLKTTNYQSDKAYRLSTLKPEDQLEFTKLNDDDKMKFFRLMDEVVPLPVEPIDLKELEAKFIEPVVAPESKKV